MLSAQNSSAFIFGHDDMSTVVGGTVINNYTNISYPNITNDNETINPYNLNAKNLTTNAIICGVLQYSRLTLNGLECFNESVDNHNSLAGLQGGTTNEYYHLTSTQLLNYITNFISSVRTSISSIGTGLSYNSTSGEMSLTQNMRWEKPAFAWTNGTNVLAANTRLDYQMGYNGTYSHIDLKSQQSGSINVTVYKSDDTYICSATITANTIGSADCTPYAFVRDEWIYYKIISVVSIKDIAVSPRVERTG